MAITYNELRIRSQPVERRWLGHLLSLDPGHTTGYAIWNATQEFVQLVEVGHLSTWVNDDIRLGPLCDVLRRYRIDCTVMESYQVYEWKTQDHSWSQVPTLQVIGGIKIILQQHAIPYCNQTAQVAKQFCTDDKLRQWGFYKESLRHARDAIRHGAYFLLFRK